MKDNFSKKVNITEIARFTNKTRPSIYKYVDEYTTGVYKDIPHSFVLLFDMINNNESKEEIINFCDTNFKVVTANEKVNELILLLKENYQYMNLEKIEKVIRGQMK